MPFGLRHLQTVTCIEFTVFFNHDVIITFLPHVNHCSILAYKINVTMYRCKKKDLDQEWAHGNINDVEESFL